MIANPFDRIIGGSPGQVLCNPDGSISVTLGGRKGIFAGAGFLDLSEFADPPFENPAGGHRRLFIDPATAHYSVLDSAGAIVDLESGGATPTATIGLAAVNGAAATFLRSDGAPALAQTIVPTWTGQHTFSVGPIVSVNTSTVDSFDVLLNIQHSVLGTPLAGFGTSVRFGLESSTTLDRDAGAIVVTWTDAIDATRTSKISFQTVSAGGGLTEALALSAGFPAAPTAIFGTNTTQLATTAYVINSNPIYARVSGSNATTTGQSLVNVTGLTVPLAINAVYEFEANLTVSTSTGTNGTQYGIQYSVAGGAVEATLTGSLTTASDQTVRMSALNTPTVAFLTTTAQSGGIIIKGIVTTGANAGNLTVQHLKVTSGTSTVFINSFLKVRRIA